MTPDEITVMNAARQERLYNSPFMRITWSTSKMGSTEPLNASAVKAVWMYLEAVKISGDNTIYRLNPAGLKRLADHEAAEADRARKLAACPRDSLYSSNFFDAINGYTVEPFDYPEYRWCTAEGCAWAARQCIWSAELTDDAVEVEALLFAAAQHYELAEKARRLGR